MNYNKAVIVGRVATPPELRKTQGGQSVASMSVATNRAWTDKNGSKQEAAEFHNVVLWGKTAETVGAYLEKGSLVLIEGRIETRSWEDKDGITRRITQIVAESVQFGPRAAKPKEGEVPLESPKEAQMQDSQPEPVISLDDDEDAEEKGRGFQPTFNDEEEIKPEDIPF